MPVDSEESAEFVMEMIEEERGKQPWFDQAALATMIMAMLMAIGSLLAGMSANEALIDRQREIAELVLSTQASVEREVLINRVTVLTEAGKASDPDLVDRITTDTDRAAEFLAEAENQDLVSETVLHIHERLAIGVSILALGVTLSGMAIVVHRKRIWHLALLFALIGTVFVGWGSVSFLLA